MDGSVVTVAVAAVAAAVLTAVVATASAGAAAAKAEPVSKTGDAGCVGRSTVGVGGLGRAVGGALRGSAGGGRWLRLCSAYLAPVGDAGAKILCGVACVHTPRSATNDLASQSRPDMCIRELSCVCK